MKSVLQDWVMELPLRIQGSLVVGLRGCDEAPKSLHSPERGLVAFLRFCVMNPADPREVDIPGAFFQSQPPDDWKASAFGHYPQHWYAHLMHAFEVVGYRHRVPIQAERALKIYLKLVRNLHLQPESEKEMIMRLTEDRIASGEVVS